MSTRLFDDATMHALHTFIKAQLPAGTRPTLADGEEAVLLLFRLLGPDLIETALQEAAPPDAAKKGRRRCVRVPSPCAGSDSGSATSPPARGT